MKRYLELIKAEWERALLALMAVAVLFYLAAWLAGYGDQEMLSRPQPPLQQTNALINYDTAFAFLDHQTWPAFNDSTPFHYLPKTPVIVTSTRPPRRPPENGTPVVKPPPVRPPENGTPPIKAPPVKPPVIKEFEYSGSMTTSTGVKVALIKDIRARKTLYLRKGGQIDEFEVAGFDQYTLSIRTPSGDLEDIPFSQSKEFVVP